MNTLTQIATALNSVDMDVEMARAEIMYRSMYVGSDAFVVTPSDDYHTRSLALNEVQRYLATVAGHDLTNTFEGCGEWGMMAEDDYACEAREDIIREILNEFEDEARMIMSNDATFVVLVNYKGEEEGIGYAPACKHLQKFISKYNYR